MSSENVIIWDWDGTLVDSITYKYTDIWKVVFKDDSHKQGIAAEYLLSEEGKGKNRYGLIIYTLIQTDHPEFVDLSEALLKDNPVVQQYAQLYDAAAKKHLYDNGMYPNVEEMLRSLHSKGYRMYLISGGGTDDDLEEMTKKLEVRDYFLKVYGFGSPGTDLVRFGKMENYKRLLANENNPGIYTVIGDSQTDKKFADKIGALFIGVASVWNRWEEKDCDFPIVTEVVNVQRTLEG